MMSSGTIVCDVLYVLAPMLSSEAVVLSGALRRVGESPVAPALRDAD